jgi:hypothetical protein
MCAGKLQQEKREAMAKSVSATAATVAKTGSDASISAKSSTESQSTSLVYQRRGGRMSHALDRSIEHSFSSDTSKSKTMNRKQISPKKKPAQSVVDDPLYYNMEAKLMKIKKIRYNVLECGCSGLQPFLFKPKLGDSSLVRMLLKECVVF